MKVVLRPIYTNTWAGVKRYRGCYEDLAPYWTRSGSIYTGLTPDDAERLGDKLSQDLAPTSEFWKTFYVRTSAKDLYLFTEDPMDELRYLFLKHHKNVKSSLTEYKAGARFVLLNETEEARKSNLFAKRKREAFRAFDEMTTDEMKKALRLYGHNGDSLPAEIVEKRLYDIIDGDPQSFLKKWVHNANRDTEALLERAISKNIIRRNKNLYKYGTDIIGRSLGEAVAFLDDKKNQDVRIVIMDAVDGKEIVKPIKRSAKTKSERIKKAIKEVKDAVEEDLPDMVDESLVKG